MTTIAIANQKGGTSKTTSAHQIGAGLTRKGYKVLFVDLDAQQSLTYTLGAHLKGKSVADLLQQAIDPERETEIATEKTIQHTRQGDILTASANLAGADLALSDVTGREYKLMEILKPIKKSYDFCIIDCPPTLGTLTVNALTAADMVIAPAQADVYSLIAITQLSTTISTVKRYCNPKLIFKGVLLTRYNGRAVLSRDMAEKIGQAATQNGTRLFNTRIRECTAIKEAELTQQDIFSYAPKSNGAADYTALLEEVLAP